VSAAVDIDITQIIESMVKPIRLLHEANPIAFLAEQDGGVVTDGNNRIPDKIPKSLHERIPLIVGSKGEVARLARFMEEAKI